MRRKSSLWQLLAAVLILALVLTGCTPGKTGSSTPDRSTTTTAAAETAAQQAFARWEHDTFVSLATSDSLTLHYTAAHPETYGIKALTPTFGDVSAAGTKAVIEDARASLAALHAIKKCQLTEAQQLTYEIMEDYLNTDNMNEDWIYYSEPLSANGGTQIMLPQLLAEYTFYSKSDVEDYLKLAATTGDLFASILTFEQEKSAAGLFMSDTLLDQVQKGIATFIRNPKSNYLISVFNTQIEGLSGLTAKEIKKYEKQNKEEVLNIIIPAYKTLSAGLEKLRGTGTNEKGIGSYPLGKEYYNYLAQSGVGSSMTAEEMNTRLQQLYDDSLTDMQKIASSDPDALSQADNPTWLSDDPATILSMLSSAVKEDYPEIDVPDYKIKYVDQSLEDETNPAFYLTCPIDDVDNELIYINKKYTDDSIFTTLAHEGFPGHLYQRVYAVESGLSPLRLTLNYNGYAEGWGTYAELWSYSASGFSTDLGDLLKDNRAASLAAYAMADIGVGYEGWTEDDLKEHFTEWGFDMSNEADLKDAYLYMVNNPAVYLSYAVGYCEFLDLRDAAKEAWGSDYSLKRFHTYVLNFGEAPFDIMKAHLKDSGAAESDLL